MEPLTRARTALSVQEVQYNLQTSTASQYNKTREHNALWSKHYISDPDGIAFLNYNGIGYNPNALTVHPHPISKTIENFILYYLLKMYLTVNFTAMFMKNEKANTLRKVLGLDFKLINMAIEAKDKVRYRGICYKNAIIDTADLWIHDAAHYMTPRDISLLFIRNPKLENIYCTVVIPPELLENQPPLNPKVYTFEKLHNGTFLYYPDGNTSEPYVQHVNQLWWYKHKTIKDDCGTLTIQKLHTIGAHSLMMVTRSHVQPPLYNTFSFPNRGRLTSVFSAFSSSRYTSIDLKLFRKMAFFGAAAKKLTKQQVAVRARSILANSDEIPITDCFLATEIGIAIHETHMDMVADPYLCTKAYHHITRRGPIRWIRMFWNQPQRKIWEQFMENLSLAPYTALQELTDCYVGPSSATSSFTTQTFKSYSFWDFANLMKFIASGNNLIDKNKVKLYHRLPIKKSEFEILAKNTDNLRGYYKTINPQPLNNHMKSVLDGMTKLTKDYAAKYSPNSDANDHEDKNSQSESYNGRNEMNDADIVPIVGAGTGLPMLSKYTATYLVYMLYYEIIVRYYWTALGRLLSFTWDAISWPKVLGYFVPALTVLIHIAPTIIYTANNWLIVKVQNCIRSLPFERIIPETILVPYYTIKLNTACTYLDNQDYLTSWDAPILHDEIGVTHIDNSSSSPGHERGSDSSQTHQPQRPLNRRHGVPTNRIPIMPDHNTDERTTCLADLSINHIRMNTPIDCDACCSTDFNEDDTPPLPIDNLCLIDAFSHGLGITREAVWRIYSHLNARAYWLAENQGSMDEYDIILLCLRLRVNVLLYTSHGTKTLKYGYNNGPTIEIDHRDNHFSVTSLAPTGQSSSPVPVALECLTDQWLKYTPDKAKARVFLQALISKEYGTFLSADQRIIQRLRTQIDLFNPKRGSRKMAALFGNPGAGKSEGLNKALTASVVNNSNNNFTYICPTNELREKVRKDLSPKPGKGFKIKTHEIAFTQPCASFIILDDAGRFPPGYIDALCILQPQVQYIYVNGDPAQEVYVSRGEATSLNLETPFIETAMNYAYDYLRLSHRLPPAIGKILNISVIDHGQRGEVIYIDAPKQNLPTFVPDDDSRQLLLSSDRPAYTYASTQGLTFNKDVQIIISERSRLVSDRSIYTALTRSKGSIYIVKDIARDSGTPDEVTFSSPIMRALYYNDADALTMAVTAHQARFTPAHLLDVTRQDERGEDDEDDHDNWIEEPTELIGDEAPIRGTGKNNKKNKKNAKYELDARLSKIGRREELFDALAENAPNNHRFLDECPPMIDQPDHDPEPEDEEPTDEVMDIPPLMEVDINDIDDVENLLGTILPAPRFADEREAIINGKVTEQVDETNQLTMLFLHHKRTDEATVEWTNHGRFKKPDIRPLAATTAIGSALYLALVQTYKPASKAFDNDLWERCVHEDQEKFLSKGYNRIVAIDDRGDPDWHLNHAELFLKGQSITKPDAIDRIAKMGQLVVSFNTEANFKFGPMAKYLAYAIKETMPNNVFFLDGKTDHDLSKFVKKHWDFTTESSEDDYIGFDAKQGTEFINFDIFLMRHYNMPETLIEEYVHFMTNIDTFMGTMGSAMPSGCKFTLLFNTMRSIAYQCLKYNIDPEAALAATGDDIAYNGVPSVRHSWLKVQHKFQLESKRKSARYPTFCGWILNPVVCYKQPKILLARTLYQIGRGNIENCALSYAADLTPMHTHMATLLPYLSDDDVEHYATTLNMLKQVTHKFGLKDLGSFVTDFNTKRKYNIV